VGREGIDPGRAAMVPEPHAVQHHTRSQPLETAAELVHASMSEAVVSVKST
jgi:hypothetical protein